MANKSFEGMTQTKKQLEGIDGNDLTDAKRSTWRRGMVKSLLSLCVAVAVLMARGDYTESAERTLTQDEAIAVDGVGVFFGGENSLVPQFFDGGGQDWGRESQRCFYGLENDLPNVLRTLLMHGKDEDGRVDIPMFRITGLPEGAGSEWLTDKIKVGAHYIDFRVTKGERSREE